MVQTGPSQTHALRRHRPMCLHGYLVRDSVGWRSCCRYSRYGDVIPVQLLFWGWIPGCCLVVYVCPFNVARMVLIVH